MTMYTKISEFKIYVVSYLGLMILLCLSVLMTYLNLGILGFVFCLLIACLKGLIIFLFFMHAIKDKAYLFIFGALLLFLISMLILILSDFRMRTG